MSRNTTRAIRVLFSVEALAPFLIGSLCLAVLGNAVFQVFANIFGTDTWAALQIGAVCVLLLVAAVVVFARVLSRLPPAKSLDDRRKPDKHKGLILLVSRDVPCRTAIRYHQGEIRHCWLICSLRSLGIARQLRDEFPEICAHEPLVVNDVYDPLEYRDWVRHVYERLPAGLTAADVIADFAGMTASGSLGLVNATLAVGGHLQYTPAEVDEEGNPTGRSLNPIQVVFK